MRAVLLQREVIEPRKDIERKPILGIKSQAVRFVRILKHEIKYAEYLESPI